MKDTIKSTNGGYSIRYCKKYGDDKNTYAKVYDGMQLLFIAQMRSKNDYLEEKQFNECFEFFEKFTTRKGNEFIYWHDYEINQDYLTKVNV